MSAKAGVNNELTSVVWLGELEKEYTLITVLNQLGNLDGIEKN
jgi:hypothetical protein